MGIGMGFGALKDGLVFPNRLGLWMGWGPEIH